MAVLADRKERLASLTVVALLHLVLGWALLMSLAPTLVRSVSEPLGVFNVREIPPPPPEPKPKVRSVPDPAPAAAKPSGAAAPPAPRRAAPPVVVPKRITERDLPPPVAAGLVPASGSGSGAFSSERDGTGTGSGGSGSGTGSGTSGSGRGGGGRGGTGAVVARPELRSGRITPRDYPRAANEHQGAVEARLSISRTGAVTACSVTRSSGNAVLDATTCRLMRERFRFTPARDAQSNAVPGERVWQQRWWRD